MNKLIIFIVLFAFNYANAQTSIGQWQVHVPHYLGKLVTKNKNIVYSVSNDGIFTFNTSDRSINRLSKVNGLSDVNVTAINANEELDIVVMAYENSNIDLIKGNEIVNISDIKDKQVVGNKRINSILFVNDYAYLSCGFGIVKLDIEKNEISETYYIGDGGMQVNVSELSYDGTFLYAATEQGIYKTEEDKPEIVSYENWEKCTILPNQDTDFTHISVFDNKLFTLSEGNTDNAVLYQVSLDFTSFELSATEILKKRKIKAIQNELTLFVDTGIYYYNRIQNQFVFTKNDLSYPKPRDIFIAENSTYISDYNRGLIEKINGNVSNYAPNGPINSRIENIDIVNSKVWAVRGGRVSNMGGARQPAQAYIYESGVWAVLSNRQRDWTEVKINPKDTKQVFIGSINYGLIEIYDNKVVQQYDTSNFSAHTLQTIILDKNYIRVGGLVFDDEQNLWMTNLGVEKAISVRKKDGTWKSFNYKEISEEHFTDIIITKNGTKWTFSSRFQGMFAFHNNGTVDDETDDLVHKFINKNRAGETLSNSIYAMAEDKNGVIWLGTSEGIIVYYNPENVFDGQEYFYASQITIDDNGVAKHLLKTELVQTIDIDGANRKWIGTEKSGVYVLSADGTQEIEHFTEDNSPLLSNNVGTIKIDDKTGTVFISTNKGLITYKGDATEADEFFGEVYAYPNPVRPEYEGDIIIKGLVDNTSVKITDIAGNFVFETISLGGQALWNGKTLFGERVKTGIYLIFLSNSDGSKTAVTKLLFIN